MKSNCLICGSHVTTPAYSEIIVCENQHCIRVVEDAIGLHYAVGTHCHIGCDIAKPGQDVSVIAVYQDGKIVKSLTGL